MSTPPVRSANPKLFLSGNQTVARFQKKYASKSRQEIQIVRTSAAMEPEPQKFPTPWLADSEWLLAELTKTRETILRIPLQLGNQSDIQAAIDRIWNLEKNLRFLLHLHREGQRSFAKRATDSPSVRRRRPGRPQIVRIGQ